MCWLGADSRVVKMVRLGRELVIGSQFSLGGQYSLGRWVYGQKSQFISFGRKKNGGGWSPTCPKAVGWHLSWIVMTDRSGHWIHFRLWRCLCWYKDLGCYSPPVWRFHLPGSCRGDGKLSRKQGVFIFMTILSVPCLFSFFQAKSSVDTISKEAVGLSHIARWLP